MDPIEQELDDKLTAEIEHDRVTHREITIGILVFLVLFLLGVVGYLMLRSSGLTRYPWGGTAATTTTSATPAATTGNFDETAAYYEIKASFPATTPLNASGGAAADQAAVAAMKQYELSAIAQFKKDGNFANLTHDDVQIMGLDQNKESLDISYRETSTPGSISYIFVMTEDTGGAHPNTTYRTFTWNAKTGAQMSLADLFPAKSAYLSFLSTKTRALLPPIIAKNEGIATKDVDLKMLNAGTGATADNFADWYLEGTDFVLIFPPYQVAAYAAGVQMVRIPAAQLVPNTTTYTHVTDWGTLY